VYLTVQEQCGEQSAGQQAQVIKLWLEANRLSRFRAQQLSNRTTKTLDMFLYRGKYRDVPGACLYAKGKSIFSQGKISMWNRNRPIRNLGEKIMSSLPDESENQCQAR